jgi:predicted DNA-binding transcriptional regulator YafY
MELLTSVGLFHDTVKKWQYTSAMNRAVRLLELLQILRTYRYPVSGQRLAERMNISIRTLYRDVATLQAQGADIQGEPGMGYILRPGFFIPPLMFSQTEIEAVMLGILWVSTFGDPPLAKAATNALSKIAEVLPPKMRNGMGAVPLRVGPPGPKSLEKEDLTVLRDAIRQEQKVTLVYQSKDGQVSERIIWPFAIGYFTDGRILVGWCEEKQEYRHFRTDRIKSVTVLEGRYPRRREILFREWHASQMKNLSK